MGEPPHSQCFMQTGICNPISCLKNAFLRKGFRHTWQKANPISDCLTNPGCQRTPCSLQEGSEPLLSGLGALVWFVPLPSSALKLWGGQTGPRADIGPATRSGTLGLVAGRQWWQHHLLSQFLCCLLVPLLPSLLFFFYFLPCPFSTFLLFSPPFALFPAPFKKYI